MKYRLLSIFMITVALSSCEKVIEFDGETREPKLVVNSLFGTLDTLKVNVSHSLAVNDQGELSNIPDAQLELFDGSGKKVSDLTHLEDGNYAALDFLPTVNEKYTLKATHSKYKPIEVSDWVPAYPAATNLDTVFVQSSEYEQKYKVSFDIDDKGSETNYYMVEVFSLQQNWEEPNGEDYRWMLVYLNSNDPNTANYSATDGAWGSRLLISDANFNGNKYNYSFELSGYFVRDTMVSKGSKVRVSAISEAVYNYFNSYQKYVGTVDNPFANPVQVYSNVEGGFGIFGGAAPIEMVLKE